MEAIAGELGDRMDGQVAVATTEDASDLQMSGSPERIAPTCGACEGEIWTKLFKKMILWAAASWCSVRYWMTSPPTSECWVKETM
nr:hypothetical protein Iba_chr06bCG12500 [Ipomoea batatas]GMD08049.1 hypothetical protein Iba_chr06cCG13020 [Ipomoea batatas]GME20450.1 hypothetical protein Iba_scaffold25151CG0010 [Ipomoea batatas]